MRFFDVGQEARGFIAIGQLATGVIAFGQMATGVIAIGQLARGVVAIGQGSVGLFFSGGMMSFGLMSTSGMLGIGGRRGIGGILEVIPSLGMPRVPPRTTTLHAIHASASSGWVSLSLAMDAGSNAVLVEDGQRTTIKLDRSVAHAARVQASRGGGDVLAFVEAFEGTLVCTRLMTIPERPFRTRSFWQFAPFRFALLCALAFGYWIGVGNPILAFIARG